MIKANNVAIAAIKAAIALIKVASTSASRYRSGLLFDGSFFTTLFMAMHHFTV